MGGFKKVNRCKKCGKIYPHGLPLICKRCGAEIAREPTANELIFNHSLQFKVILTKNAEKVIARRRFFKWEVLEKE